MLQRAADLLMARGKEDLTLVPGYVRSLVTGQEISLGELARFFNEAERIATHHFRAPTAPEAITDGQEPQASRNGAYSFLLWRAYRTSGSR